MKNYKIKFKRMEKNITQNELCKLLQIGRCKLSKIEHGDYSNLTYPLMIKTADVLGVSVKDLFFGDEE